MLKINFLKKPVFIVPAAIAVIFAGYFMFRGEEAASQDFTVAKRANLVQGVSVTGKVRPARSVDLSFEKGGRVLAVRAGIGAKVGVGQTLVELDSSELSAQVAKAEADLAAAKAELETSRITLANYYGDTGDTLNDAYAEANDAVRKQLSDFFSDDEKNPQLTFQTSNAQNETDLEFYRLRATQDLNDWLGEVRSINSETAAEKLDEMLSSAKKRLEDIRAMLDLATDSVLTAINLSQSTASTYQTSINTARTNINAALSSVNTLQQNIASQKSAVNSKDASAKSAEANAQNIKAQLGKLALRSPIYGTVTKQEAEVGEVVKANDILVTVISSGNFEIEANVPEADIAKLKIGDRATVTLDAYGNDVVFEARVASIDPAETVIEGVATYKTTLVFVDGDGRIKSGMTANVDIVTAEKENVILVPQRAIITRNGDKFVLVGTGGAETEERKVEVGLRGSDGNIEIISGMEVGEMVSTFGETP